MKPNSQYSSVLRQILHQVIPWDVNVQLGIACLKLLSFNIYKPGSLMDIKDLPSRIKESISVLVKSSWLSFRQWRSVSVGRPEGNLFVVV
jgi:hypothetical protein